jgi:thiosulfate dehydrogenase [quinone] large subunit
VIGYHFLFEGIEKAFSENWTSQGYLLSSEWILSDLFQSIAMNSYLMPVIDFINIWGQIIAGVFLIIGFQARISAFFGAFLLALYYAANPPFLYDQVFVNLILLEFLAFMTVGLFNTSKIIGIDRLINKRSNSLSDK